MKILLAHASAGAGHTKAAEAVFKGVKAYTAFEAACVDALDYTSPWYKNIYRGSYTFMISKCPVVWGFFFGLVGIPVLLPLVRLFRRIQNFLNAQKFEKFLIEEKFDYILATHFFPIEVAAHLKRAGKIHSKLICIVTDFDVHNIWLAEGVDIYTVASDWTKTKLQKMGVAGDRIFATGIPTDEKFAAPKDVVYLKRKIGLKENVFTVLVATGSFGIGPIEEVIDALNGSQVLVICGNNKSLYERLKVKENELVKVLGLVSNMDELMAVSDCMVTKPGGLSICEALVCGLPLIFFHAIPGQETSNIEVLHEYGVGVKGDTIEAIAVEVEKLRSSPDYYKTMVNRIRTLAKPNAVKDIIKLIV